MDLKINLRLFSLSPDGQNRSKTFIIILYRILEKILEPNLSVF
jgi:hypothetical protein